MGTFSFFGKGERAKTLQVCASRSFVGDLEKGYLKITVEKKMKAF